MSKQLIKTRIVWPTGNQAIGWSLAPARVRFHAEDVFEITNASGDTTIKTETRAFFVEVPLGGEILVEDQRFQCRTNDEVAEHSEWERDILSRGLRAS